MNRQQIRLAHNHWCIHFSKVGNRLYSEHTWNFPKCIANTTGYKYAARYWGKHKKHGHNICEYSTAYAAVLKERYDETIAHEVCHSFLYQTYPNATWHGEMFVWLMRTQTKYTEHQIHHDQPVWVVKKVAEIMKLKERMTWLKSK